MSNAFSERKIGIFTTLCSVLAIGPNLANAQSDPEQTNEQILSPIHINENQGSLKVDYSSSSKFTVPLLNTPKSVTIVPEKLIEESGATNLQEALRTVPGVTFGAGEGGNPLGDRPFIRGFDSQGSIFIDGIRSIGATTRETFDIASIEVIKGSDSLYSGRGGAGGSINIISKTPHLGNAASAELSLGDPSYARIAADGNWQLGEHTAFRLNVMKHRNDIAGRDNIYDSKWGIAPSISFGLGTRFRANVNFYHLESSGLPDSGIPYAYSDRTKPADINVIKPADVPTSNFYGLTQRDYRDTVNDIGALTLEYDLIPKQLSIKNTTQYTRSAQNYLWTQPQNGGGINNSYFSKDIVARRPIARDSSTWGIVNQTELNGIIQTAFIEHHYLAGFEYTNARGKRGIAARGPSCPTAEKNVNCTSLAHPTPDDPWTGTTQFAGFTHTDQTIKAFYLFDTLEFTKEWLVNLGIRIDDYNTSTLSSANQRTERHDTLFNWQAGLIYKPVSNLSLYGSYATSSTPGGYLMGEGFEGDSRITNGRDSLAPEKHKSYEIGAKWNIFENQLALNAALFQIDTDNARIQLDSDTYAMAGKRTIRGFEIGVNGNITDKWEVFGGYTYLDSESKNNGLNTADNGKRFPTTPRNNISIWTNYHFTPKFTLGFGSFYASRSFADTKNTRFIPAYFRVDGLAKYRINKNVSIQLNAQNIFNEQYFSNVHRRHYLIPGMGRTVFATLKIHTQ